MSGYGDHDPYDDWTDRFDDMDGADWADHYSLFEPDPEQREIEDLNAYLESEREADDELAWQNGDFSLPEARPDAEAAARQRKYDRWVREMHVTTTLQELAQDDCPISAQCRACAHSATLNPKSFLRNFRPAVKLQDIAPRLRCRKCGTNAPVLRFDPERIDPL